MNKPTEIYSLGKNGFDFNTTQKSKCQKYL